MKKITALLLISMLFISASLPFNAYVDNSDIQQFQSNLEEKVYSNATVKEDFADDSIVVVLNKSTSEINKEYKKTDFSQIDIESIEDQTKITGNISKKKLINKKNFHQILNITLKNKGKENVLKAIKKLEGNPNIKYVGPNYKVYAQATPNDPSFGSQWGLSKIEAPQAWNVNTGNSNIVVGVLDSGIDSTHPDFSGRINTALGMNFTNDNAGMTDPFGHGTHVAGIIGAAGNDGTGVSGVNWNVTLASLRVFDSEGEGYMHWVRNAINYAQNNNISILNFSGGGTGCDQSFIDAINNYSGLLVCAAGNERLNTDYYPQYPSNIPCDNVISVGSSDSSDAQSFFSNYGLNSVDLFAPGTNILSTFPLQLCDNNNCDPYGIEHVSRGYHEMSGTSMAAPFVTGVAALLKSADPSLSASQIKKILMDNADAVPEFRSVCLTGGRLNAYKAISNINTVPNTSFSTAQPIYIGTPVRVDVSDANQKKYYSFTAPETGYYTFSSSNRGIDNPKGWLYSSWENVVLSNDDGYIDGYDFTMTYYMNQGDQYYIAGGCSGQNTGKYSITVIKTPADVAYVQANSQEYNDRISSNLPYIAYTIENNSINIVSSSKDILNVELPSSIGGLAVTTIGNEAFAGCSNLASITIPNSVIHIENSAFAGCSNLSVAHIGNSVKTIGNSAFADCSNLSVVHIGDSVESIGISAFFNCANLVDVTIPDSVTSLGQAAFEDCVTLRSAVLSDQLTEIKVQTFYLCGNLTNVDIGNSVTNIQPAAFYSTALNTVTIPNSVITIDDAAFQNCANLSSFNIGNSVTTIGFGQFFNCANLTSINIPNNVTTLKGGLFRGCIKLTNVVISNQVTKIDVLTFDNCPALQYVTIPASVTDIAPDAFSSFNFTVYGEQGSYAQTWAGLHGLNFVVI